MRRTSLLTYWTGKDIEIEIKKLDNNARQKYLERLRDILVNGFWMNVVNEVVKGWHPQWGRVTTATMQVPMVCFTELRLSKSENHNKRYGLMGVVVDREFVLARHGGPVFYVRSQREESIVANFGILFEWLNIQVRNGVQDADIIYKNCAILISYLKAMSVSDFDDFEYLDENEWRIVHAYRREDSGLIRATGIDRPKYKIPLSPKDIKMIVLPDSQIRNEVMQDMRISKWFDKKYRPLLTVEEV